MKVFVFRVFLAFGLNRERYYEIRTRKTPNMDTFQAVKISKNVKTKKTKKLQKTQLRLM